MYRFTIKEQLDGDPPNKVSFAGDCPVETLLSALGAIGFVGMDSFLANLIVESDLELCLEEYSFDGEPFVGHHEALLEMVNAAKRLIEGYREKAEDAPGGDGDPSMN